MAALTEERDTQERDSAYSQRVEDFGGAALDPAATFHKGALIGFDTSDSLIKPAETSTTLIALGRAELSLAAGESGSVPVRSGTYGYDNSTAGDLIANSDAGSDCYIVDDQTVALTNGGATRSVAGKIVYVSSSNQVFVAVNPLV